MTDPVQQLQRYSQGLIQRLEEFFARATGETADRFCAVSEFDDVIRTRARDIASRAYDAFGWLDTEVRQYQAREGINAFRAAKDLGGLRLVLGGSSRFGGSQLQSVTSSVLYSDTVLIPDPIMPWLERERTEEKFQYVLVLKTAHALLHLKPLVDADLPYPALAVFPSWEKSLEQHDKQTKSGIQKLVADVVAWATGERLNSFEEILDYLDANSEQFLKSVDRSRLFVAPGGLISAPLRDALQEYENELRTWRSEEWLDQYYKLPVERRVLNGLLERTAPIYHMLENAQELFSHPLMCIEQQAHYFQLVSRASNDRLTSLEHMDPRTSALVEAVGSRRMEWISGVNISAILELRKDNENEAFRKRLVSGLGRLSESDLSNINRVAAEVCREIDGAIAEYERDLRRLKEKYNRIHGQTAVLGFAGVGAALIPALAPLAGSVAPLGIAAKYGHDKLAEGQETNHLERSFAGVLASVKQS